MNKRQIGNSDLFVSEVGLGCMSLGTDESHAVSLIEAAINQGVNYLDTADLYDSGLNEEFVGKAIKHKRQDIILATKAGNRLYEDKPGWYWDPSKSYIKDAVKKSLQRLQTDYIDLYQLHGGTVEDNIDETIEAFEELKQEGLIRYYGISSIRPNVIKEYLTKSSIVSIMMQYSLLDRRPEEWFPLIKEHHVSIIARGPLAKGLLTEKPIEQKLSMNGYLSYNNYELESLFHELKKLNLPHTMTELALKYCLYDDVVAAVIPGASKEKQLFENITAVSSQALSETEYKTLQKITKLDKYEQHR
ncbi:aldo/keto reductase [Metabacillus malikii]|uniref:Aryl-alcohol dehydrogenase-like predicted oxidoreductase n=1 Tax=Metabacillus malikii TaxID=1504265 RepID=A0ABT9ZIP5_9BACI|nr:aldo/keto reductase [Metabacillus malikii]MDQ0231870.1 aryl-alcohol dehydrogenase-like predicted oxidoreductase [Metabacillus malikii]